MCCVTRSSPVPIGLLVGLVFVAGCSLFQPSPQAKADRMEPLLIAAGFRVLSADTAAKLAHLQRLQPLTITPRPHHGTLRYAYADPYVCRCMLVGDEHAFQKYQRLAVENRIADEEREAAMMNEAAAAEIQADEMEYWGPFDSWE